MTTPGDNHEIAAAPPTNTTAFLNGANSTFKNVDGVASTKRLPVFFLRSWGLIQRGSTIDVAGTIRRLLDAVPQARIAKPRLIEAARQGSDAGETEYMLGGVFLTARPIYQMRTILDDRRVNGRVVFLTAWESTWEPATNLPSGGLRKYRQRKRRKVERAYIEAEAKEE
ncbi:hypothetical protein F443_22976 [Phytophthora nicotianae P1569]|uniref:Chromo domain-containing protein n=1 Tax=Phytophthora nicotianae P1569 TaxID=1317065 RepID=V9DSP0_PHYNI|nr:hypothetical protein F443_23222 [Phytophthora nicotianae P1569]ETI29905.1 hypothetical protein F443_22976 [Phytophthora nicotianae P1569]